MPPLIINGQPQSTYVRSARMACIEAGVEHELRPLAEGSVEAVLTALRSDAYRKKHPFARMPSLEDGNTVVFETSAIARYVSDTYGNGCLVPSDPAEAIRMEQWVSAANCYIIPDTARIFIAPLLFHDDPDMDAIERDKPILRAHYERLDAALVGRTVIAGDTVSIADLLYAPLLHLVGNLPGGTPLFDGLPNLERWWLNISQRPSFAETYVPMPDQSSEAAA
jgi:glutathione S-transferase